MVTADKSIRPGLGVEERSTGWEAHPGVEGIHFDLVAAKDWLSRALFG